MSFPRLILDGDVATFMLSSIRLEYPNDTGLAVRPETLTRSRYDVKRQFVNSGTSSGTGKRYPDTAYDQFRLIHTWVGYCDVITDSVAYTPFSDSATAKTVALLKTAAFYNSTTGIPYCVSTFIIEGPTNPSSTNDYVEGFETGLFWQYGVNTVDEVQEPALSILWAIKDTNIQDIQNNTSRVTFTFELVEPWEQIKPILA